MTNVKDFSYDNLSKIIHTLNTNENPANAHGMLCGLICAVQELNITLWLSQIAGDNTNLALKNKTLTSLYKYTNEQLNCDDFSFEPIIAEEIESLDYQVESLTRWCQGFLFGLRFGKIKTRSTETLEAIRDISNISKLSDEVANTEDNSRDFYEILEFVRMSVLLIYQASCQQES